MSTAFYILGIVYYTVALVNLVAEIRTQRKDKESS